MAVRIRLRRMGSRNAAFFRLVVQDARRAPTGRFIETLGWYDPKREGTNFSIKLDRVDYWLARGAQPSETAVSLIKKARALAAAEPSAKEEDEIPVPAAEEEPAAEEAAAAAEQPSAEEAAETAAEKPAEEEQPAEEETEKAPAEEASLSEQSEETAAEEQPAQTEEEN